MTDKLTNRAHRILAAVLEEQRQTRRGTTLDMIGIATNCRTPASQDACNGAVLELVAQGLLGKTDDRHLGITAKGKAALEQAPEPEPEPTLPDPAASEKQAPRKPMPSLGPWPTQARQRQARKAEAQRDKTAAQVDETAPQVDETAAQVDETAQQASARRQAAFQEWQRENTPPPAQHQADQVEAANEAFQQVTVHAQQAVAAFQQAVAAMNEAARHLEELRR